MIVPLQSHHSAAVAQLHLDYLRSHLTGKPGRQLLKANYQTIAGDMGACGFVAESDSGQPVGYVCGVWDPKLVRNSLIRNYWSQLSLWGALQVIYQPGLLLSFLQRTRQSASAVGSETVGYELRPIVVAPAARGTGVALELVNRLLMDADQRGFKRVYLLAEPDNTAANTFYQRAGFRLTETVTQQGIVYNRYERPVCEAA